MRAVCLALVIAAPAIADDLAYSNAATEACLTDGNGRDCIGLSANACMETPGGSSTVGMGYCAGQELAFWDSRLNDTYRALMAGERARDAAASSLGGHVPERASALRDMQRAWIGFRDAACVYEYAQWGGGTGGGPANAFCLMQLTAEQALVLEDRLEDHQR